MEGSGSCMHKAVLTDNMQMIQEALDYCRQSDGATRNVHTPIKPFNDDSNEVWVWVFGVSWVDCSIPCPWLVN